MTDFAKTLSDIIAAGDELVERVVRDVIRQGADPGQLMICNLSNGDRELHLRVGPRKYFPLWRFTRELDDGVIRFKATPLKFKPTAMLPEFV